MFRLAGHLKMTIRELGERMDMAEFREWWAYCRFVEPFGQEWLQTGIQAAATIAPYSKGRSPKPTDFMPIETPPQTMAEMMEELAKLKRT